MRRLCGLFLAVALGLVVDRLLVGVSATAAPADGGGATTCVTENGDVNADGTVNLSDAVTVLGHLFLGGPTELVGLCAPAEVPAGLPTTGQSACYGLVGNGWLEVPCARAACQGQDAQYAAGCPGEGRFTDNGDGTVTDHCTGLMWQKDAADVNGDGRSTNNDSATWCDALAYCESLSFAGHDDWRLPNVRELESIVDYGRFDPAIDPVFRALLPWYWSSTTLASLPGQAWFVGFNVGHLDFLGRDNIGYVRAVRSGP